MAVLLWAVSQTDLVQRRLYDSSPSGSWPVVVEMLVAVSNTVLSFAHTGGGTSETTGMAEEEVVAELVAVEEDAELVVG